MSKPKVIILGSTGFLGKNLVEAFTLAGLFDVITTTRESELVADRQVIFFDYIKEESWEEILDLKPDFIINAAGYGVVKYENDLQKMYDINYLKPVALFESILKKNPSTYWIHIGTAFEYDVELKKLSETSPSVPKTHYGISKWMFSHYLQNNLVSENYLLIRPFGMFGPYEDNTKIFPYLILSQLKRSPVDLSSGTQVRDYIYVKDVARFILSLIESNKYKDTPKLINVGSSEGKKLREIAEILSTSFSDFNPDLWRWGSIPQRVNESDIIVNSSQLAQSLGFKTTIYEKAFLETINYYKEQIAHA